MLAGSNDTSAAQSQPLFGDVNALHRDRLGRLGEAPCHGTVRSITSIARLLAFGGHHRYPIRMGEHIAQQGLRHARIAAKRPRRQTPETTGRLLLQIVVYDKRCRVGGTLTLDDLAETEIGDWKMPDFRAACSYSVSQGWLVLRNDTLTLTTAGLAAA